MATDIDWLDRLDNVFDYGALQKLFDEIADRAVAERENAGLAKRIDEVIRRIEEERASDQTALDAIKGRYEAFQQDNRGVVGWFKRHVPFSEARRQDVHHRAELADQQAEVLADNLVIARAQMLKERFLASADRKLGHRTNHWQSELGAMASVAQLAALSAALKSLAPEIDRSRDFIELVKRDVEAFATAAFSSKEDRVRRDGDLAAARAELAELAKEVGQKEMLKREALKRLGHLVTEELTATDSAFRDDSRRLTELESLSERLRAARETLGQLKAAAEKIGALNKELHAIPEQLQQLRVERQQAERRQTDAAVADARKTAVADERRARCDEARRRVDQALQSLAAIEQAETAWRAGHTPEKTMSQMVEAAPDQSPHAAHRREAQAALNLAQTACREALQSFEMAEQEAQQARLAMKAVAGQLASIDGRLAALEQRRAQLQHEAPQSSLAGQAAFAKAAAALATFLGAAPALSAAPDSPPYGCVSGNQLNATWGDALLHADRDVTRHLQAIALLEQLSQWQQSRQRELDQNREAIAGRRSAAWKRRCSDLLGYALAGEAPLVE